MKELVARTLAHRVKDGEVIGIGSGSTAELAIQEIKKRITTEGLRIIGVPTSYRTALMAKEAGIEVCSAMTNQEVSWAFDGADEVDSQFNMIKGRGGAMLSEKIMARRAKRFVIIVSEDKFVDQLGKRHPVPVEVIPEALLIVEAELKRLGAIKVQLRDAVNKYGPVVTEHNNLIVDAWFAAISPDLELKIKSLIGVVESGLFVGYADEILVAKSTGVWSLTKESGKTVEKQIPRH